MDNSGKESSGNEMEKGFIQWNRGQETNELLEYPIEFWLLGLIASRARRNGKLRIIDLLPGQALIGDLPANVSERAYRTAKKRLTKWNFATFKATNKGTIATLTDTSIYDIHINESDEQNDRQTTGKRRASDEQVTTNEECKEVKKETTYPQNSDFEGAGDGNTLPEKKRKRAAKSSTVIQYTPLFEEFHSAYPRRVGKAAAFKEWKEIGLAQKELGITMRQIIDAVKSQDAAGMFDMSDKGKHCAHPATWLNDHRWEDEIIKDGVIPESKRTYITFPSDASPKEKP